MGLLIQEFETFEHDVVNADVPDRTRDDIRLTFFAGAASVTTFVAQQLMQEPETLHVLLKHLADDIAAEGKRAGFDWECIANAPTPPLPDGARMLAHFVDLSRLPADRKAELFDMIQDYARRYSVLPSAVN